MIFLFYIYIVVYIMGNYNSNKVKYELDRQNRSTIDIESINLLDTIEYDGMITDEDKALIKKSCINFDYEIVCGRTNKANITIRFFSSNKIFELLTNMNAFYNIKFVYNNDDGELNHIIKFNRCILRKIYSLQANDHLMIVAEFTSEEGKEKLFENICK